MLGTAACAFTRATSVANGYWGHNFPLSLPQKIVILSCYSSEPFLGFGLLPFFLFCYHYLYVFLLMKTPMEFLRTLSDRASLYLWKPLMYPSQHLSWSLWFEIVWEQVFSVLSKICLTFNINLIFLYRKDRFKWRAVTYYFLDSLDTIYI